MLRSGSLLLCLAIAVGACGTTPEERAVTGGGLGAAGGAVVGAVTQLAVLEGVLIGGAIGAATGALTSPDALNLGEPIWKRWSGSGAGPTASASSGAVATGSPTPSLVASTQALLTRLGYEPGPVDGVMGPRTSAAIREYQLDRGLPANGWPSTQLELQLLEESR
ncbi:MAG: peptidoglycan-binding protein [Alphaproteobacteria bacterium]